MIRIKPVIIKLLSIVSFIVIIGLLSAVLISTSTKDDPSSSVNNQLDDVPSTLKNSALQVDYSKSNINVDDILSGGPGKDGIPALTNPDFVSVNTADIADSTETIVVTINDATKAYPYSIMVWHEIVNDTIGGKEVAVTFCPLCGSAVVFDRLLNGEILEFGVSGFLYESNLLMYDRSTSESLWSQSIGKAVVGDKSGQSLGYIDFSLMTFNELKDKYPDALVLSKKTGFSRDYTSNPYSGYEDIDQTYFPVSVEDKRYPPKELFYIIPLEGYSVAFQLGKVDGTYLVPDSDIIIEYYNGQPVAKWGDATLPGYYEMWFSWATHNQNTGIVI